jgi:hypothetical protein
MKQGMCLWLGEWRVKLLNRMAECIALTLEEYTRLLVRYYK